MPSFSAAALRVGAMDRAAMIFCNPARYEDSTLERCQADCLKSIAVRKDFENDLLGLLLSPIPILDPLQR